MNSLVQGGNSPVPSSPSNDGESVRNGPLNFQDSDDKEKKVNISHLDDNSVSHFSET